MITQLIIILVVLSLFQPSRERTLISITFSLSCLIHLLWCDSLNGMLYYLSAGVFDLIVLLAVCVYAKPSKFTDCMVLICVFSLFLNFYGWRIYESYMEPTSYNIAFHILYMFAVYTLLKRDWKNDALYNWLAFFRSLDNQRGGFYCPLHKEAKF